MPRHNHGGADRKRRRGLDALLVLAYLLCAATAIAADKTDVVVFANGDRLTGEIKSMERGQLSFKTDATDTISIKWDRVVQLETQQYLQVELTTGLRYFGQAPAGGTKGTLRVVAERDAKGHELELAKIIRIAAIDRGKLLERLDGYVTGGYDYTHANRLEQITFTGGLSARDQRREWSIDGSATSSTQTGVEDTQRYDATAMHRRFLQHRNFWQGFGGIEGNDELGLDLRSTLGGGFGRFLAQTARSEWSVVGGLAVVRENFNTQSTNESIEAVLGTEYSLYRYDTPEANIDASLYVLPSLTESGRVRTEAKVRSRYEIVSDLFFEISFYSSYDSDPDAEANANTDYGVTTSLGYSF